MMVLCVVEDFGWWGGLKTRNKGGWWCYVWLGTLAGEVVWRQISILRQPSWCSPPCEGKDTLELWHSQSLWTPYTCSLHCKTTKATVERILSWLVFRPREDRPRRSRQRSVNLCTAQIAMWNSLKQRLNPCHLKLVRRHYLLFTLRCRAWVSGTRQGCCCVTV